MKRTLIKDKLIRVDLDFDKQLEDILKNRIKIGKENPKHLNGTRRYTKAMARHPLFKTIKDDIIVAELEDDRRMKLK